MLSGLFKAEYIVYL